MIYLKIDDYTLKSEFIKDFKIAYNKIDGEGTKRNLQGNMRRQVIANKLKISVSLIDIIEEKDIKELLNNITKDTARVSFYNPKTSQIETINAYFNTPETSAYDIKNDKIRYSSLSFNIIQL